MVIEPVVAIIIVVAFNVLALILVSWRNSLQS